MRITIVGGGNIGTQFAVHCAEKGHEVTVYTSEPYLFDKYLSIVDENGNTTHKGEICLATNDPEIAFPNAEIIIITMPATMMKTIAEIIYQHTDATPIIGVVPGNGGSECAFYKCIDRGNVFFGIERVPAIARLIQKGKTVRSTGYREELHVASLPAIYAQKCADIIANIFDIKTTVISCFLNLTMTPSNPILHTTRLRTIFNDWHPGMFYDDVPLFYEEWDDASSELLFACDDEVQKICAALPEYKLDNVKSLRIHYESPTIQKMTEKISSIPAFRGLKTPVIGTQGRFQPDLHSRYFTADFSYGLTIIKQVAELAEVQTPNIDETMMWYKNIAIVKEEFRFSDFGITDKNTFSEYYLR